ncbi:MAG TPA: response regulator, partial [Verrucomicrobiae bacterium]|nr:response regulator [Verrucomicrobiae bacterium]
MEGKNSCRILIVEDDPDDALLIERAFKKINATHSLTFCVSLQEAVSTLERSRRKDSGFDMPHLIISDLKLGLENGFRLLKWVRANPAVQYIPVVFMSGSLSSRSVSEAYSLGANTVVLKPAAFAELPPLLERIATYWCEVALLPEMNPST